MNGIIISLITFVFISKRAIFNRLIHYIFTFSINDVSGYTDKAGR